MEVKLWRGQNLTSVSPDSSNWTSEKEIAHREHFLVRLVAVFENGNFKKEPFRACLGQWCSGKRVVL